MTGADPTEPHEADRRWLAVALRLDRNRHVVRGGVHLLFDQRLASAVVVG